MQQRSEVIDYSPPLEFDVYKLFMRKPSSQSYNFTVFLDVWGMDIKMTLVGTFALFLLLSFSLITPQSLGYFKRSIYGSVAVGLALIGLEGPNINSGSISRKIFIFTVFFFGSVSMAIWNAGLTSQLTIELYDLPVQTLQDLLSHKEYSLVVMKDTYGEFYFEQAKTDSITDRVARQIYSEFLLRRPDAYVKSPQEGIQRILHSPQTVYFENSSPIEVLINHCTIKTTPAEYSKKAVAIPFPQDSPYLELFSDSINRIKQAGLWKPTKEMARAHKRDSGGHCPIQAQKSIGIEPIISLFMVISIGIFVSVTILMIEKLVPNPNY